MSKVIDDKKRNVFPWIDDWSDPQNKYRFEKNVNNLIY